MGGDKWYLAGPMTGIPQFNFPAFEAAAWALRKQGYDIISPHEEDPESIQERAWESVAGDPADLKAGKGIWGERLAHDVYLIVNGVTGLILLPGWDKSRGVALEATVALLEGKKFRVWDGRISSTIPPEIVARAIGQYIYERVGGAW
jgi:hypothetical protein